MPLHRIEVDFEGMQVSQQKKAKVALVALMWRTQPPSIIEWVSTPDSNIREFDGFTNQGLHHASRSATGHYQTTVPIRRAFRRSFTITDIFMEKQDHISTYESLFKR